MIKQELTVGTEVPDKLGVMYKVIADKELEGFSDQPPIVALCLGFSNLTGTEWAKVETLTPATSNFPIELSPSAEVSSIVFCPFISTFQGFTTWFSFFRQTNIVATKNLLSILPETNRTQPWSLNTFSDFSVETSLFLKSLPGSATPTKLLIGGLFGNVLEVLNNSGSELSFNKINQEKLGFNNSDVVVALVSMDAIPTSVSRIIAITDTGKVAQFQMARAPTPEDYWRSIEPQPAEDTFLQNRNIRAAASGNNAVIVVGDNGFMAISYKTSEDADEDLLGAVWSEIESPFGTSNVNCITYNNYTWIAGARDGKIATSRNGTNWTLVNNSTFETESVRAITYGNGMWIAVGNNSKIAFSRSGTSWQSISSSEFPIGTNFTAIAYAEKAIGTESAWVIGGNNNTIGISASGQQGQAGKISYFYRDGKAGNILDVDLDIFVEDVPPHDFDPNFKLQAGRVYRTRGNQKVVVANAKGPYQFEVKFQAPILPNLWSALGYTAWYTGRRYADKTDSSDIIEDWKNPLNFVTHVQADKYQPFTLSTWGDTFLTSSNLFSDIPAGKTVYQVNLYEALNDTEIFKLVTDGE